MKKITSLSQIVNICKNIKKNHQSVGLITGCFDILHAGHIDLFRFAKKHVDVLIIGLENDETIRLSKGPNRPVHILSQRLEIASELVSVDYVFAIPITVKFAASVDIRAQYVDLVGQINPNYLITSPTADNYWKQKRDGIASLGIKLLKSPKSHLTSTTAVLDRLQKEL